MTICNIKNDINYWETIKPIIDNSLILYITPDYDGNYNDISGKLNSVINYNSSLEQVDSKGLFGFNMVLNGINSYLKVLSSNSLNSISTGFTISIWIYKLSHSSGYGSIIGRRSGTGYDDLFIMLYGSASSNYSYSFHFKGSQAIRGRSSSIDLNKWVNITVTYDGVNMKMYLNGILESTLPSSGIIPQDTTDLYIGCGDNGTGGLDEYTNAKIGTTLIYNRGINQSEVLTNVQSSPYYYLKNTIL